MRLNTYIHKLVAEYFIGERPEGYEIDHIDGNYLNNRADNLRYVTRRENLLNPNTPNGGRVSSGGGGNPHKGSGNPGRPAVHTATYTPGQNTSTQPSWTPDNFEGSYFGNTSQFNTNKDNLDDNSYAVNGIQRGFDGRSSIGI